VAHSLALIRVPMSGLRSERCNDRRVVARADLALDDAARNRAVE
jgi:hypothetical protein